jgi:hypothetical protein
MYEGNVISTAGSGVTSQDSFEKVEASFKVTDDELIRDGFQAFLSKIGTVAEELAAQREKLLIAKIQQVTGSTGKVVDAKGELSPQVILEALEKIDMEFDDTGKPKHLAIVLYPNQIQKFLKSAALWAKDPEYLKAYNELMRKKREEWRAREDSRKLVD